MMPVAAQDWGDRLNPLTVRVVRQQLRSWAAIGSFLLPLFAALITTVVLVSPQREGNGSGRELFFWLAGGWSLLAWVALPVQLAADLASERRGEAWDLIALASLPPGRMVIGWFVAGTAQQAMLGAAIAPFLLMTCLMKGVDPLVLSLTLIGIPVVALATTAFALHAASSEKRPLVNRVIAAAALRGLLIWGLIALMTGSLLARSRGMVTTMRTDSGELWFTLLLLADFAVMLTIGVLVGAAMNLTSPALNRSTAPRLVAWAVAANAAVIAPLSCLMVSAPWQSALGTWAVICACATAIMGVGAISERYDLTPRQARFTTLTAGWGRTAQSLLAPGAAAGRRCFLVMACACLVAGGLAWALNGQRSGGAFFGALAVGIICYASVVLMLSDSLAREKEFVGRHQPRKQRIITWWMILGSTIITGIMVFFSKAFFLCLFSPVLGLGLFIAIAESRSNNGEAMAGAVLVIIAAAASLIGMTGQATQPAQITRLRAGDV